MTGPVTSHMFNYPLGGQGYGQYRAANTTGYGGPGSITNTGAGALYFAIGAEDRAGKEARHRAIPSAGIRVGEITGWRTWRILADYLVSAVVGNHWMPDEPMAGDIVEYGVHAFKRQTDAFNEYALRGGTKEPTVIGQVALWGEIVEHENGYRAEFGKPVSLDIIYPSARGNDRLLADLRKRYKISEDCIR